MIRTTCFRFNGNDVPKARLDEWLQEVQAEAGKDIFVDVRMEAVMGAAPAGMRGESFLAVAALWVPPQLLEVKADPDLELAANYDKVWAALERSVTLQSHYAKLLNDYDGGERFIFTDAHDWLKRLDEIPDGGQYDRRHRQV